MRILVINETARIHTGGLNRVVVESVDWLRRSGQVVALGFWDDGASEVAEPFFRLPSTNSAATMEAALAAVRAKFRPDVVQLHSADNPFFLDKIAREMPACRFLHDQSWFCSGGDRMAADLTPCHRPHGVRCWFWHYAQGCGGKNPVGNWRRWRLARAHEALRRHPTFRIQVASRFMRQGLLENGYAGEQIDVVPLFSNPARQPAATEPGLILCPSRLVKSKGIDLLLEAARRLPMAGPNRELSRPAPESPRLGSNCGSAHWRLAIAGDGPERRKLERLRDRLGLTERVEFLGELAPSDMDRGYARAALVVSPVLRPEPFGLVGPEAMAHGKPVIAFAGGAIEEWLVDGKTGRVVRERSPAALASTLAELLEQPEACRMLGEAARRRWEDYRPEVYVRQVVESFGRCVEGFQNGRQPRET